VLASTLLLTGTLGFTGMLPAARTATASTVGAAQSFGARNASGSATLSASSSAASHVMVIVMENKAYSSAQGSPYIIGNANAPYINNTLVKNYTSATQ
jgi:hypothetical protein